MRIAVIDGQGGGIGRLLVQAIKQQNPDQYVLALGTNSVATGSMLKAGADEGATGERAIVVNVARVDVIMGVMGIVVADALMGELSPAMATAIGQSTAHKLLIPQNRCGITVIGATQQRLQTLVAQAVAMLNDIENRKTGSDNTVI